MPPRRTRVKWFEITAEKFEWMPNRRVAMTFPKGYVGPQTAACVKAAVDAGAAVEVPRPPGVRVGKDGSVTYE
jgi:hypothetical protein